MKLSAAEWARVEALYPQAAELAGEARARWLDKECALEVRVRAEIEAMLEAASRDDGAFDAPVGLSAAGYGAERAPDLLPAGSRLGSWRIKSLLGQGGMGEVYLAERGDGAYAMHAAIKLLKAELYSFTNAQRFLRERRVLARLSHPNIARVLDAGTTDDGRPYLVMEYVDGARITDHARTRELKAADAARLILAVAEAVAEAHRCGVVHRDLKPANVLVTGDQQVKLLDFGIAKLMDEDDGAGAILPMTPAYAAPEQIRGEALSPATDVYALGAMLFQLVTHRLPHLREGLPLPVIASGLRDETIERPSRVVLGKPGLLGKAARRAQAQALSGDLDWIVLKALQSDPARRYRSAAEFAEDLQRSFEHRPVLARQDSLAYRAARFTQRYPVQVVAATAAVAALSLSLVAAMSQARSARMEADRAERMNELVLSVFGKQDPQRSRRAEQALRESLAHMETALGPEAYPLALVEDALADTLAARGQRAEAVSRRRRALELTRKNFPDAHPPIVAIRQSSLAADLFAIDPSAPELPELLDAAIATLKNADAPTLELGADLVLRARLALKAGDKVAARADLTDAVKFYERDGNAAAPLAEARNLLNAAS